MLAKELLGEQLERKFIHAESVFAPWRKDNKRTLQRVLDGDLEYMKLEKIIKDEKDEPRLKKKLLENMALLKEMHMDILSASDQIPSITWLDFTQFALEC